MVSRARPCGLPVSERGAAKTSEKVANGIEFALIGAHMMTEANQRHRGNLQHDEPTTLIRSDDEPEPEPQLGVDAPLRSSEAAPGPPPTPQPQAVSIPKKAMAASVPGSEYWLP